MQFKIISSLAVAMASSLYLVACGTQRSFYRTRGKVLMNGNTIHNSSVFSSEDCLGECYSTPGCNSFNTIEIKKTGRYVCQLLTNERTCDLVLEPLEGASVYFSSRTCLPILIFKLQRNTTTTYYRKVEIPRLSVHVFKDGI